MVEEEERTLVLGSGPSCTWSKGISIPHYFLVTSYSSMHHAWPTSCTFLLFSYSVWYSLVFYGYYGWKLWVR